MSQELFKKTIVFLSSKSINVAYDVAAQCPEFEVFLIMDKKIPIDDEQELLGNFYVHFFDKEKVFQRNEEKYFDLLAMYLLDFEPDLIVCSNYHKKLSQSFIDFVNFRNSHTQVLNIAHEDLNNLNEKGSFISVIHSIEKNNYRGKELAQTLPTYVEELQEVELLKSLKELDNYRVSNVVIHYHEQSKIVELLVKNIQKILM